MDSAAGARREVCLVKRRDKTLIDGQYVASCKDKTFLAAVSNGHSLVWPQARMVVRGAVARFFKPEGLVWSCNASYAGANFDVRKIPTGWYADSSSRAGMAHHVRLEEDDATSLCGRTFRADALQRAGTPTRQCSRCSKLLDRS